MRRTTFKTDLFSKPSDQKGYWGHVELEPETEYDVIFIPRKESRKVLYLAHPYGDREDNRKAALRWAIFLCDRGYAVECSWIALVGGGMRKGTGIQVDRALVKRCDALVLLGTHISEGMKEEIEAAEEAGVPIIDCINRSKIGVLDMIETELDG